MMRTTRRLGAVLGSTLLSIAAAGGVMCIVAVIAAAGFNITLVMFKTGSMSPTMPAGSLAIVKEIPAEEIHVGDVITVDRTDALPITHRVTAISPSSGPARSVTLKGDANSVNDPQPYTVTQARIVLFAVPGLAAVVLALSQPVVLSCITLATAALVTWAFWPRRQERRAPRHRAEATP
jgi:signal peptidase